MALFEDQNIAIDFPTSWRLVEGGSGKQAGHYNFSPKRDRPVCIQLFLTNDPQGNYRHWHTCFCEHAPPNPRWTQRVLEPYEAGPFRGFRVDYSFDEEPVSGSKGVFALDRSVLFIEDWDLRPEEREVLYQSVGTLKIKPGYVERIRAAWDEPDQAEVVLDATDLTKPRTKKIKTWMDHQMILLRDGKDDDGEGWDFPAITEVPPIIPVGPDALYVTSQTEWGVTLEFVVRQQRPTVRKRWWNRDAEAVLSLPSGRMFAEATTGGLMLEIKLMPGDYSLWLRGSCPPDADSMAEGVERLQLIFTPVTA